MKPIVTIAVLVALALPTVGLAAAVDFVDVARQHPAAGAVQRVVTAGLVSGYPDHTFRGWKPVSRYELIASTAHLLPNDPMTPSLGPVLLASDVDPGHWAFPALARLHQVGIGQALWAGGLLAGDRPATRFDLAYLAAATCGVWSQETVPPSPAGGFADVPAGHWAATAVQQAAALGLMDGQTPTTFGGDVEIDRFQLAVVLDRLMTRVRARQRPSDAATAPVPPANGTIVTVTADEPAAPPTSQPAVVTPAAVKAAPRAAPKKPVGKAPKAKATARPKAPKKPISGRRR